MIFNLHTNFIGHAIFTKKRLFSVYEYRKIRMPKRKRTHLSGRAIQPTIFVI